jgi:D-amino peptidase
MKVYISADIEGVTGITSPDEANPDHADVGYFQEQMTREVVAACEAAIECGATDILVKDAHWTGRNINPRMLPECARMVRGWSGHPYAMMEGLNDSYDAAMYIGYHSRAGSDGNPLAHTISGRVVEEIRINGIAASEFLINTLTATLLGVPVVFLSGDRALCEDVMEYNDRIQTFATTQGIGTGTISLHPDVACSEISQGVIRALKGDYKDINHALPEKFDVELDFKQPKLAFGRSFYPGCERVGEKTISFRSDHYFEVLRMMNFTIRG